MEGYSGKFRGKTVEFRFFNNEVSGVFFFIFRFMFVRFRVSKFDSKGLFLY